MADRIRTALEGGGRIILTIQTDPAGNVRLQVTEDWARLTSVGTAELTSEALSAEPDPDKRIAGEIERLFAGHIHWKAR